MFCLKYKITNNLKVCDFTFNCQDGSDELNCGPCTFEKGQYQYITSYLF